ncbi:Rieske 2Fe-2S domain-containing protein [Hahella sp. SMD15-11]|uniref:Rieske 2Fe-2S domain-containing protein n=1 Tax=Thermohahella caldifontis TaxID=3142973 RepID=A0AB39UVA3_9GAMM
MCEYHKLCLLDDLDGTGAWGGTLDGQSVFVIRTPKGLRAWLNQCPHQGVELNWQPHRFWDPEHQYVQCTMHGALFSRTPANASSDPARVTGCSPCR